ncbi:hypothetical protein K474DRAFT_1662339 [Panus rudis PR-1116 ss-1]|nr:hypothetical protein K474DRAFT_1662339 [Panus rudis PR-1116 ss-1]
MPATTDKANPEELADNIQVLTIRADANTKHSSDLFPKLITNDLLFRIIFDYCSPGSLLRCARLSRDAYAAVKWYMARTFDINKLLSRFFDDPVAFRSMQAKTATLISGSTALQFFDRSFYPDSDLDLYVWMKHRIDVGKWLMSAGYVFQPNSSQDPKFNKAIMDDRVTTAEGLGLYSGMVGVAGVFTFVKPTQEGKVPLKVQMIVAVHAPMEIILYFHSTVVMNVISYEKAYSLYPWATFEEKRAIVCRSWGIKQEEGIAKYRSRGWEMLWYVRARELQSTAARNYPTHPSFLFGNRWITDRHVWSIPLDLTGVELPKARSELSTPMSHDPVDATSWKLTYPIEAEFNVKPGAATELEVLSSKYLYHRYVSRDGNLLAALELHASRDHRNEGKYYDEEWMKYIAEARSNIGRLFQ